jgi:hypothetical protein
MLPVVSHGKHAETVSPLHPSGETSDGVHPPQERSEQFDMLSKELFALSADLPMDLTPAVAFDGVTNSWTLPNSTDVDLLQSLSDYSPQSGELAFDLSSTPINPASFFNFGDYEAVLSSNETIMREWEGPSLSDIFSAT